MFRGMALIGVALTLASAAAIAQGSSDGPYKVLKTARVGGEGGWDYIYADPAGRRLYIPRRGAPAAPAADGHAAGAASANRLTIFDLDTLQPVGTIDGVGGQGTAVDPQSGHGFTSSKPVSMFDTKTLKLIKTIDVGAAAPDGILFDPFNERVYIFSHPTKNATVIDAKDGTVVGTIDLGGVPEEAATDGHGTLYVVMQDMPGSVTVVDARAMKATAHYPLGDHGHCNGLALDARNHVLVAACANSGNPPAAPPQPAAVVMQANTGKILATLPLPGGSDGAVFDEQTGEAFITQGNGMLTVVKEQSPTSFTVEENLQTMNGARTIAFDPTKQHIYTMSDERLPAPPTPPGGRPMRGPAVPGSFTILMIGK